MITWQPNQGSLDGATTAQPSSDLESIIDGSHDTFITQWAREAKATGHTIYLRLMHEMNADWYPWGYGVDNQTPTQYVAAFRHIVDIFHQVGATNVQFVWCVASQATVKPGAPPIASFFPGDAYVSWVAMDGYNHSPNHPKTFSEIFASDYATLTQISSRPIMIAELGTVEIVGSSDAKAQWITDTFLTEIPQNFPRVMAVLYFDLRGHGYSYPLASDPASLAAYRKVVNDPYYQMPAPQTTLSF
jgi:beta-mannanase